MMNERRKCMGDNSRTTNSKKNVSANLALYFMQSLLSFVVRTIFIKRLGAELIGLDNLLLNILAMLSVAELGFSTAISYALYKPLAENDISKINAFMSFYRKVYNAIGCIILVLGSLLAIFLKNLVKGYDYKYIYLVYFLYLFYTAVQYFISYKEVLLFADQKEYKIFKFNFALTMLIYILQILLLLFHPDYVFYICITIICKILYRSIANRYITKYYSDVDFKSKSKLEVNETKKIRENVLGLFVYKVGEYAINCTDNIIISAFINIITVGLYTNYLSIVTVFRTILKRVFAGITASFGNLSTMNDKIKEEDTFIKMSFLGLLLSGYISLILLLLFNPLVTVWLGKQYVLSFISVCFIVINFYLAVNQIPLDTVKEAKGFYKKDRYVPLIQAVINVGLSVVLAIIIGFNGVLIATSLSYILTVTWNKPYMIYKYVFEKKPTAYFIRQVEYILVCCIIYFACSKLFCVINLSAGFLKLLVEGALSSVVYALMITVFFCRTKEYKYLYSLAFRIIKRK